MKKLSMIAGVMTSLLLTGTAFAKVSPEEAAKLGTTLTPLGSEKAGNADGTIPAWDGGLNSSNAQIKSADPGRPDNPFPDDEPLFIITNENLDQFKENLSPGQLALFETYPNYKMPIYETRRTVAYPKDVYRRVKQNATSAELAEGGNGVLNYDTAIPFPIPQSGLEVLWNHITRYRGGIIDRMTTAIPVQSNGSFVPVKIEDKLAWPESLAEGRNPDDSNILYFYQQTITAPATLTGTALLVHETINQVKGPRKAWVYSAGQRRVRRAPNLAYDGPGQGSDGLRTNDNLDMFNGAPDQYAWKLVGKREMYIPYNAYKLLDTNAKYEDIVIAGHLAPEYTRYELHRVWEVEATLKEGIRNIYGKRVMYFDEDSWGASIIDHYDERGNLWRVAEAHRIMFYDVDAPWLAAETLYDLNSRRYLVTGLANEEPRYIKWGVELTREDFSSSALRRLGR